MKIKGPFSSFEMEKMFPKVEFDYQFKELYTLEIVNDYFDQIKIESLPWKQIYLDSSEIYGYPNKTSTQREYFTLISKPNKSKSQKLSIENIDKGNSEIFWFNSWTSEKGDSIIFYKSITNLNKQKVLAIPVINIDGQIEIINL